MTRQIVDPTLPVLLLEQCYKSKEITSFIIDQVFAHFATFMSSISDRIAQLLEKRNQEDEDVKTLLINITFSGKHELLRRIKGGLQDLLYTFCRA